MMVVARPRIVAVIGWSALIAIGLSILALGTTAALVVGGLVTVLFVGGLVAALRLRAWVEGTTLRSRTIRGENPPIELGRLTDAHLTPFGRNNGRQLRLRDATGAEVLLDATNATLGRLYPVLAEHIPYDAPYANDLLQRRLREHRPGPPLTPG